MLSMLLTQMPLKLLLTLAYVWIFLNIKVLFGRFILLTRLCLAKAHVETNTHVLLKIDLAILLLSPKKGKVNMCQDGITLNT